MDIKSQDRESDIISAKADPVLVSAIASMLKRMMDSGSASVKISYTDGIPDGEKSEQITITSDADTSEQSGTTSSTK